jgi:hypothetical protein
MRGGVFASLVEGFGIHSTTGYKVVRDFWDFASCQLALAELPHDCRSGERGRAAGLDKRNWSAGRCEGCAAAALFNRWGRCIVPDAAIDHQRMVHLKAMGIRPQEIEPAPQARRIA